MAKAQVVYLTGKANWFHHLFEPDEYLGVKKFKLDFYPDPKSLKQMKDLKIQKKLKENAEGQFYTLSRPLLKPWKDDANPEFGPPRVLDRDGKDWNKETIIGNGSSVTIKLEVYNTRMGVGNRLDVVRIDEHIPYTEDTGMPDPVQTSMSEITPEVETKVQGKLNGPKSKMINDPLPF